MSTDLRGMHEKIEEQGPVWVARERRRSWKIELEPGCCWFLMHTTALGARVLGFLRRGYCVAIILRCTLISGDSVVMF